MTEFPIWRIRPATADDADALSLVASATFLESFAGLIDGSGIVAHCLKQHSADKYRDYLAKGAKAWLAEVEPGHAPVGYALICAPELELAQAGDLELKRIYLLSRFQGSMMAGTMMRIVREAAAAAGHERLLLGVKNDNHRALAFYAKHGFETIGTRTFDVGGKTYDDYVLALKLANTLLAN
jgi:ribosomal protein S18 acetylase RimI-like enzyme